MGKYSSIFEPLTVKQMTIPNRIVMTPMGTNFGEQNGEMSFLHINYYEQRAMGGTGLIIVEMRVWIIRAVPMEQHSCALIMTTTFHGCISWWRRFINTTRKSRFS